MGTSKSQNVTAGEGRPRKVSKKARARVPLCHQLFLSDFFSTALIRPCPYEYDMEHAAKNFIPLCNHSRLLRATASKYRAFADSEENSDFLLLRQKDPFGELFPEIYLQSSSEFTFL